MADPVRTLLLEIEEQCGQIPGCEFRKVAGGETRVRKLRTAFSTAVSPGYAAFVSRYDGGRLLRPAAPPVAAAEEPGGDEPASGGKEGQGADDGMYLQILGFEESQRVLHESGQPQDWKGLWPVAQRGARVFALDFEAASEGEQPVVEVGEHSVDRVGSSFLRFLSACLGEIALGDGAEPLVLARELCRRDPGLAEHWVHLIDFLEDSGRKNEIDAVLDEALRCASPPGPALVTQVALRALDKQESGRALAAIEDALGLEPLTARDDDARLDAAAILLVLANERGDDKARQRALEALGGAAASTGAYWRGETVRAFALGDVQRAQLAGRVAQALIANDADTPRMSPSTPGLLTALRALLKSREALEQGDLDEAVRQARVAVGERADLGICHAVLAEGLNATRARGALEAALRATELNPALVDGWRELGDAYMEAHQPAKAEEAYREALSRDESYALARAKLAQALLEQGRSREALDMALSAEDRGSDAFMVAAIRGDILAEMSRHEEAAESYDRALRMEPEDHWILHQAAIAHSRAGNDERAADLFELALRYDRDGCHQTLVDYGDLLRRVGRIGDAVRMYRKAVAAVPGDPDWRRLLRDAERELMAAPN
ncbi:MAG: tetratricopeptide repeat protein [Deltaproteobacteria bacterium]|nr:tetratricopeptide repeat protein [Deltaproteobacteria bacterium]